MFIWLFHADENYCSKSAIGQFITHLGSVCRIAFRFSTPKNLNKKQLIRWLKKVAARTLLGQT
ncbi:hypothetical protein HYN51_15305 [Limnobaculum parvum]|uniref:Transposase n=1 Tax=Limnobaculum parvum TaxID=2172103 RepID=A0A2Y9U181_9GAMM|nr:hypothetical protein HYN51_15305 [Limnobaculum parvum]